MLEDLKVKSSPGGAPGGAFRLILEHIYSTRQVHQPVQAPQAARQVHGKAPPQVHQPATSSTRQVHQPVQGDYQQSLLQDVGVSEEDFVKIQIKILENSNNFQIRSCTRSIERIPCKSPPPPECSVNRAVFEICIIYKFIFWYLTNGTSSGGLILIREMGLDRPDRL